MLKEDIKEINKIIVDLWAIHTRNEGMTVFQRRDVGDAYMFLVGIVEKENTK